jgi:hypothetical protein
LNSAEALDQPLAGQVSLLDLDRPFRPFEWR